MRINMNLIFKTITIGIFILILISTNLVAQNPDIALTEAERDSILADYDQIVDDINNRFDTAKINYKIDKEPSSPWN